MGSLERVGICNALFIIDTQIRMKIAARPRTIAASFLGGQARHMFLKKR